MNAACNRQLVILHTHLQCVYAMYTGMQTHTHMYIHMYSHMYDNSPIHTCIGTHTYTYPPTYVGTCTHKHILYTHTDNPPTHTNIGVQIHACTHRHSPRYNRCTQYSYSLLLINSHVYITCKDDQAQKHSDVRCDQCCV